MSILNDYILNEGLANQMVIGGGVGTLAGGVGGHLIGKLRAKHLQDQEEKSDRIAKYRNRGMIGGAVVGGLAPVAGKLIADKYPVQVGNAKQLQDKVIDYLNTKIENSKDAVRHFADKLA